ncbi:MAG: hypothetical protein R3C44_10430 [Chloroflexota bacterium]
MNKQTTPTARVVGVAAVIITLIIIAGWQWHSDRRANIALASTDPQSSNLPAIFVPDNTPTPVPTNTPQPTATATPGPTGTPRPTPDPNSDNLIVNGSFEDGWTDIYSPVDNQLKQQPTGWVLSWLEKGEKLYDDPVNEARSLPECLHKPYWTLPENEWLGGPNALILDGDYTYKMFNRGNSFGSELLQMVSLPAGTYRLTVPVQLHWQENLDPNDPTWDTYTAESGAWIVANGQKMGQWANAREMGDREWYYHEVEFTLNSPAEIEVLLRFKSKYANKDFFIDAVLLEAIN